ncbi:MAG: nickel-dependent hydrogenase large subunit [Vicinamibacterales bacterium]
MLRRDADLYPFCEGRLVSSRGLDIDVREYGAHFAEEHVAYSNALRSRRVDGGACAVRSRVVQPLTSDRLDPDVRDAAARAGLEPPCRNPFRSLLVRLVEILQATTEAIRLIERYDPPPAPSVPVSPRAATGHAITEAPRGALYHRYTLDDTGAITDATIVPPTSQNQLAIEEDLGAMAPELATLPLDRATQLAEQAVRNFDPCISCATHALSLRIESA